MSSLEIISEPINKLTTPIAVAVGKTLADCWDLAFGAIGAFAGKKRASWEKDVSDFKKSLLENVSLIPESDLTEPALSIIGPALEASKYYFEEKVIRELFAKLISKTMDRRFSGLVHPAFVEIIRQLSCLDAQNLVVVGAMTLPIVSYRFDRNESGLYSPAKSNVFLANPNELDIDKQAASITLLNHLGLLEINYQEHLIDSDAYEDFNNHVYFERIKNIATDRPEFRGASYVKGYVTLSSFGETFFMVCCS